MCTINEDHVMYSSRDLKHNKQTFLSFWATFCPLTLLTTWKFKILKIEKNARRYHHFTKAYQKSWSYAILFLRCGTWCKCYFSFSPYVLPFYPFNSPKNQNFKKMKKKNKNTWRYQHFTHVYPKLWSYDVQFHRYGVQQTDRWMKKVT